MGGGVGVGYLCNLFVWRFMIFLWRVRIVLGRFERWVSKGVQKFIPVLSVQSVKYPGGQCPVRVNVQDHLLYGPYHILLVGKDGSADFLGVVTPYC